IEPLVIAPNPDRRVALVKLKPGNIKAGVALVEKAYKNVAGSYPFEYHFLDEQFNDLYKKTSASKRFYLCLPALRFLLPASDCLDSLHLQQQSDSKKLVSEKFWVHR